MLLAESSAMPIACRRDCPEVSEPITIPTAAVIHTGRLRSRHPTIRKPTPNKVTEPTTAEKGTSPNRSDTTDTPATAAYPTRYPCTPDRWARCGSTGSRNSITRRHRRWAYALMVAALAAGAVCAGVGVSSAAPTTEADAGSSVAASQYTWRVHNFTDETLTGELHRDEGAGYQSDIVFGRGFISGDVTDDAVQPEGPSPMHMSGWVCYRSKIWELQRREFPVSRDAGKWEDVYIMPIDTLSNPVVTIMSDGGRDAHYMDRTSKGC